MIGKLASQSNKQASKSPHEKMKQRAALTMIVGKV